MVLVSPGVEVTVSDEAQYAPAPTNSTPFILLATAANKTDPTSTRTAPGTLPANANKLYRITSQRDLVTTFGNPFFYQTTVGTPIQGYELNEYGLLAAYSALGATNTVYCLRADIDLTSLVPRTGRPVGTVADGTYWLNTTTSEWGIYEWNSTTEDFSEQSPLVLSDSSLLSGGYPLGYLGAVGDYAVYAPGATSYPSASTSRQFFYKAPNGQWTQVGSLDWLKAWPTVQGSVAPGPLPEGETLNISLGNGNDVAIVVQSAPNNFVSVVAEDINDLGWSFLSAEVVNGKLRIFSSQTNIDFNPNPYLEISGETGETLLADLGIEEGTYYQPGFVFGTSAQQPLWQESQNYPKPTGSVWIKVGAAGGGMVTNMSRWDDLLKIWATQNVFFATSDLTATSEIDASGGQAIPAGTIYGQYSYNIGSPFSAFNNSPVYLWKRIAEGPTVVTGSIANPIFTNGPYEATVQVSIPGSTGLSSVYTIQLDDGSNALDFVNAFNNASPLAIPFAVAALTEDGAIQITHTQGGEILLNDVITTGAGKGTSKGLFAEAGFIVGSTAGVKYGPWVTTEFEPTQNSTTGVGTGLQIKVTNPYQIYNVDPDDIVDGGSGYAVGNNVTFLGTQFGGGVGNNLIVKVTGVSSGVVTSVTFISGTAPATGYSLLLSNWREFDYETNEGAPVAAPRNGTNWYYSVVDQVDIMVNYNGQWLGYRNIGYDYNGFPSDTIVNATDPNGPIVSASEPTTQSTGDPLVWGDLWISTADLENYPIIFRWQNVDTIDQWVRIDNTNNTDPSGILFSDARWAGNGTTNPANDPIPTIQGLLTSDYLDLDAPSPTEYPSGMLLFNLRRSGYNVKKYRTNYFNNERFPDQTLPNQRDAWVTSSGLMGNGAPYMGRKAQRSAVVQAMRVAIDTNTEIRDEDNYFNIVATPNYPELQPNMITLNADRGETGFIVGDTPMRLPENGTAIAAWATNAAGAESTGEQGLVSRSQYMGLFYPSGRAPEPVNGTLVAVPASHMIIRTLLRNDTISYPWFAPAGTRRGIIDNATAIGYIDSLTGEFVPTKTRVGIRDVLYTNEINPLVNFTGTGLLNYGNKTSFRSQSAMDRINVSRMIAFLRRQLTLAARPYVFEPNDALTREQITASVENILIDLQAKRGVYDYSVRCNETNNPPAVIDRNELYVDVAIEPVKAAEFIYVPVRIFNTGELRTRV